jgi:hypothetical protein
VLLLAGLGAASPRAATIQTLYGGFDADGTISLTYADGTPIGTPTPPGTLIPAGTYTIDLNNNSLDDLGNPHEFELSGPGVNLQAGQATQLTWTATFLPASTYTYGDALNPTSQEEVFGTAGSGSTSTNAGSPATLTTPTSTHATTTPSPTSNNPVGTAVVALRGALAGTVTRSGRLTLAFKGKPVGTLKAGRYTITIIDGSAQAGFILQGIRRAAVTITGIAFRGKRTLAVDLTSGQWFFYPTFVGKKTYFIVVS